MVATSTYHGEAMLLRWSDNSTTGRTVTFIIEDGPDASKEHPFKGLPCGKGGQRFALVAVPVGENEHPAFEEPKQEKAKQSWDSMSISQQAGILCADRQFQRWLGCSDEDAAVAIVRDKFGVRSRSDIALLPTGPARWQDLVSRYRMATGQQAEMRS